LSIVFAPQLFGQAASTAAAGQVVSIEGKWTANGRDLKKGDTLPAEAVVRFGGRTGADEAHILVSLLPSKGWESRECNQFECSPAPILVRPGKDNSMPATFTAIRQVFRAWREKPAETSVSISRADPGLGAAVSDGIAFFENGRLRFEGVFPAAGYQQAKQRLTLELVAPYPGSTGSFELRPAATDGFSVEPVPGIYRLYTYPKQKPEEAAVVLLTRSPQAEAHAKSLASIRRELNLWNTAQTQKAARSVVRGYLYSLLADGTTAK
jgi:hypothetical protein